VTNPENTITSAKRYIGRKFDQVPQEIEYAPYKEVKSSNSNAQLKLQENTMTREEIAAQVLIKIYEIETRKFDTSQGKEPI